LIPQQPDGWQDWVQSCYSLLQEEETLRMPGWVGRSLERAAEEEPEVEEELLVFLPPRLLLPPLGCVVQVETDSRMPGVVDCSSVPVRWGGLFICFRLDNKGNRKIQRSSVTYVERLTNLFKCKEHASFRKKSDTRESETCKSEKVESQVKFERELEKVIV
jgi:hypothetical protein